MTPTRQPQHCDHECVCPDYKASHSDWEEDPDPCSIPCMQRASHTSTQTPLNENTRIPTQNEFIAEFVGMEEKKRREHDAQVAKAEQKRVLSPFADLILYESVRDDPNMFDMVYSYRVAQIIESFRKKQQERR